METAEIESPPPEQTIQTPDSEQPKPSPAIKGTPEDLFKKFRPKTIKEDSDQRHEATKQTRPATGTQEDPNLEAVQNKAKEEGIENQSGKRKGFVQSKIQEADELKKQIQQKDEQLAQVEGLNEKIRLLEEQLSGATGKKADDLEAKIKSVESERDSTIDRFTEENKKLRSRLDFYELESNPEFQEKYVKPLQGIYQEAYQIVEANPSIKRAFQKALTANEASLRSAGTEDGREFENERDGTLSDIMESLPQFHQQRFAYLMNEFIRSSKVHAAALANHNQTKSEIETATRQKNNQTSQEAMRNWQKSLERTKASVESIAVIPDELKAVMVKHKINIDTARDEAVARAVISDSSAYTSDDITTILNKGAAFGKMQAIVLAQQAKLREQNELLAELQGSLPGAGGSSSSQQQSRPEGLDGFLKRFAPR